MDCSWRNGVCACLRLPPPPPVAPPDGFVSPPPQTLCQVGLYTLGRSPEVFSDPQRYDPQRWLSKDDRNSFKALAFGFGSRQCIGRRLAEAEMMLFLMHVSTSAGESAPQVGGLSQEEGTTERIGCFGAWRGPLTSSPPPARPKQAGWVAVPGEPGPNTARKGPLEALLMAAPFALPDPAELQD